MATITVLCGEHDLFHRRSFLLQHLFPHWIEAGHFVVVHEGPSEPPPADIAILHVDLTVVPPEYTRWLSRYPVVVNGATGDLRKRTYSRHRITRDSPHEGPVIVKTDANCGGLPERHWEQMEARKSGRRPLPTRHIAGPYPIFDSKAQVPPSVWDDPALLVERLLLERDGDGYCVRVYIFLGDHERCSRVTGPDPIVKAGGSQKRVLVPVPDEIREARRRLGFDYGKLDFVMHEGTPVLLDANRTPTFPAGAISAAVAAGNRDLAAGIASFCR